MAVNRWRRIQVGLGSLALALACASANEPTPDDQGVAGPDRGTGGDFGSGGDNGSSGTTNAAGSAIGRGGSAGGAGSGAGPKGGAAGAGGTAGAPAGSGGMGGASGSGVGGSPGTGGSPIVVHPGNCANLPPRGTWENVSPPNSGYDATYTGINAIVLRPDNPSIVFVGADMAGIFRSEDCGATWSSASIATGTNAAAIKSGRTWSLAIDPLVPDVMYAVQGYGTSGLWKTSNAGVDWTQTLTTNITSAFNAGGQITSVALDPTDHTHLVVESHGAGSGPCSNVTCLGESSDSGATWNIRVIPRAWSENSGIVLLSKNVWLYTALFGGLWRTADEGSTWQKMSDAYATANYYEPWLWHDAAGVFYLPTHQQGLLKSAPNDTSSWTTIANSASGTVLFASAQNLFMGDEFTASYYTASQSAPGVWTKFPAPPQGGPNSQGGASVYMSYDAPHHILYSANFNRGLWRTTVD